MTVVRAGGNGPSRDGDRARRPPSRRPFHAAGERECRSPASLKERGRGKGWRGCASLFFRPALAAMVIPTTAVSAAEGYEMSATVLCTTILDEGGHADWPGLER